MATGNERSTEPAQTDIADRVVLLPDHFRWHPRGLFVIITLSVVIQVGSFGRREDRCSR